MRVGIVGVPGAGKTTLARSLAGAIRELTPIKTIELISEYARPYIHKYGIQDIADQLLIFIKQLGDEDEYPPSTELLITDSPIFLGFSYAANLVREGDLRDTKILAELTQLMLKLNVNPRYDIIFHLPPTLKPINDGVRLAHQFDDKWRQEMDEDIKATFRIFKPRKFITLTTSDRNQRVVEASKYLNSFLEESKEI